MANNVRAVIFNDKNEFLIVTETDDVDNWKLPGGKFDAGETPLQAIRRELFEELGFELDSDYKTQCAELIADDGVSKRFIFKVDINVQSINPNKDEIAKLKWCTLSSIPVCINRDHIVAAVKSIL